MLGSFLRREPMSRVDTAWLRMERPTNLMMITGVIILERPFDLIRFKQMIAERFLAFRRFLQKAVQMPGQCFWERDRDFDLDWHIRRVALPGKAGKAELQEMVGQLASTALDKSKPLWQFHVVENYEGGVAIINRIHHCYADGLALVQVLLSMADLHPEPEKLERPHAARVRIEGGTVFQRLLAPARAGVSQSLEMGMKAAGFLGDMATHPHKAVDLARFGAHEAGDILTELTHSLTLPDDPPTPFKGPLGVSKRVAWCSPLPLADVKAVGKVLGCTVNDVLLSCATGALRAAMIDRGFDPAGLTIRATVPVNLRPREHAKKLGNHFGLVFLDLPIGEANPLRRVYKVRDNMVALKKSRQAVVAFGLLSVLGMAPEFLQRSALEMLTKKATAVATNVPGPKDPLYLAGSKIEEIMFWVPQNGTIGMGISILSFNDKVYFGLIVDKKNVPDPQAVIDRFQPELEKLLMLTLMDDWEQPLPPDPAETESRIDHALAEVPVKPKRRSAAKPTVMATPAATSVPRARRRKPVTPA